MSLIKLKNNALDNLTSFTGSASLGDMVFISSATASASASIEFSLGSYKEYKFFFVNMHPATNNVNLQMNFSIDNGSNYGLTKTSTNFHAYHNEGDTDTNLTYNTSQDLAQSTGGVNLAVSVANNNDDSTSGYLHLFNPSSTTYVKHWISVFQESFTGGYTLNQYTAGYVNDTNDLTNVKFVFSSGNIDDGKILMFGLN